MPGILRQARDARITEQQRNRIDAAFGSLAAQGARLRTQQASTMEFLMKRALKHLVYLLAAVVLGFACLLGVAWMRSSAALAEVHAPARAPQRPSTGDAAQWARGRYLAMTRGCTDCHGEHLAGKEMVDEFPMGRLHGANLTLSAGRDRAVLEQAIRQGLRADGRSLILMPTIDYAALSDSDTDALITYLQSLAPIGTAVPPPAPGPLPRLLWLFGKFPLLSHDQVRGRTISRGEPVPAIDARYGAYVAQVCQGCHNPGFSGGPMSGAPPEAPQPANLTPHADGLAGWSEADFLTAMRTGRRPDGRVLDRFMPWTTFGRMSDLELRALWRFLQQLPPRPTGATG